MPKRITYLRRRDDQNVQQFRMHWGGPHARIAVDLPGVLAYRQNHVVETWLTGGQRIDGIVELWFVDDESAGAGYASDVAERLVVDEQRFLSGLVGGPVVGDPPATHCATKVWILLRGGEPDTETDVYEWAHALSQKVHAEGCAVDRQDPDGPILEREKLVADKDAPRVAIALRFADADDATRCRDCIVDAVHAGRSTGRTDVLLAEEVVIV